VGEAELIRISLPERSGWLKLRVYDEFRGRRYGPAALQIILERAFRADALDWLRCTVSEENAHARALLERAGFTDRGPEWDQIAGVVRHYQRYVG